MIRSIQFFLNPEMAPEAVKMKLKKKVELIIQFASYIPVNLILHRRLNYYITHPMWPPFPCSTFDAKIVKCTMHSSFVLS